MPYFWENNRIFHNGKDDAAVLSAQDEAEQGKPNGVIFVATLTFAAARPLRRALGSCACC
jgi:hypothetical protein